MNRFTRKVLSGAAAGLAFAAVANAQEAREVHLAVTKGHLPGVAQCLSPLDHIELPERLRSARGLEPRHARIRGLSHAWYTGRHRSNAVRRTSHRGSDTLSDA